MTKDQEAKVLTTVTMGFRGVIASNLAVLADSLMRAGKDEDEAIEEATRLFHKVEEAMPDILVH